MKVNSKFKVQNSKLFEKTRGIFRHPLFSGSMIMFVGSMGANVVNYLYHLLMGRILGPSGYGSLASIFSLLYIIGIVPGSTSFAIVKFIASAKDKEEAAVIYKGIRKFIWQIGAVGFLILVIIFLPIANFLHTEDKFGVFLTGPIFFFALVTLVNQASMQGVLKFIGQVGPVIVSSIAKLVFGLLFVYLGFSVNGAIGGVFLAAVLAYLFSVIWKGGLFESKITSYDAFKLNDFLRYALPVLLQALAFTSLFTVDIIMVKHYLSAFDAGLYAALSTLGKIIYFAAQPVTATMFPIVSGRRARGEKYRKVFFAAFLVTAVISAGIVGFYYYFPEFTIGVLYGKEYLSARTELVWMGAFMGIYTISYLLVNFLLSVNKIKIVILPIFASTIQIIGLIIWHESILRVVQVSIVSITALFLGLIVYLGYYAFVSNRSRL